MKKCISLCAAAVAVVICRGATIDLAQTGDLALAALDNADTYVNSGAERRTLTVTPAANAAVKADSHFEGRGVLLVEGGMILIFR